MLGEGGRSKGKLGKAGAGGLMDCASVKGLVNAPVPQEELLRSG